MSINIRLPNITGKSEAEQLAQVKSYLYQVVQELNWALANVESTASKAASQAIKASSAVTEEAEAQSSFNSIKSLIIKSADIVDAYYEEISHRLEGLYVAQSDFGTYTEETAQEIEANSTGIEQLYTDIQEILSNVDGISNSIIEVNAHINSGLLYYDESGVPVYGLEIGQRTEIDGVETFNKYAQFTADKLAFFDQNGNEVAYISDRKLFITHVEVTGSYKISGFVDTVLADRSVVTRWVEGG